MTVTRPNVLILLPDQLRAQALHCAADPNVQSPHFDRLAAEGVQVRHSLTTNPVCTPARAALLTGRYPHATGLIHNNLRLPEEEITFAEVLRDQGYATGYIGKWHLDGEERPGFVPPGPRRQGFDYWAAFNRGHRYWDSVYFRDTPEPIHQSGYEPDYQTDLALEFVRAHRDRPFCLVLAWGPPHTPLTPPDHDRALYDPQRLELRPNVPPEEAARAREELAGYYGHITALDRNAGRLLDELDRLGLASRTLVVLTSDHGDLLGSHGLYRKGSPLEESARVPLLLRWPDGLPAGYEADVLAASVDLMPTLLALCGAPVPERVQGRDLSTWLRGAGAAPGQEAPDAVYLEGRMGRPEEWRAIRTRRHLLAVEVREPAAARYLFDLEADPYQQRNLAGAPQVAQVEVALMGRLRALARETGDRALQ
jgi:arylsulfatase A-like enzyme